MYGVVEIAGHQYKVQTGDVIDVEKLKAKEGESLLLDKVLLIAGDTTLVGLPLVSGAKVTAHVIKHAKARKFLVLKRRPGRYRKKIGHRQNYTSILITQIEDGKGNVEKIDASSKAATKFLGGGKKESAKAAKTEKMAKAAAPKKKVAKSKE